MASNQPIDAVYTWVDGADPMHRKQLEDWRRKSPGVPRDSTGPQRFRSRDELRYSLRSLEQHAPWIRTVYLVTNGQVPAWLDRSNDRLKLVSHAELFGNKADLPTFNSLAIEANLHRIPGLSENYLYFNDDVFLGRPVTLEDFFSKATGHQVYFDGWTLPNQRTARSTTDRAIANTQFLLDRRFKQRERRALSHVPIFYRSDIVAEVARLWRSELAATSSHRFRAADDVAMHVLYTYLIVEGRNERFFPAHLKTDEWETISSFVMLDGRLNSIRQGLASIARQRPKFFCINDDLAVAWPWSGSKVERALCDFLAGYFPIPSSFEVPERTDGRGTQL
jgi:hypothetical protein